MVAARAVLAAAEVGSDIVTRRRPRRSRGVLQFCGGLALGVLRMGLAQFVRQGRAILTASKYAEHPIPFRFPQRGSIVLTVLYPAASGQHALEVGSRLGWRGTLAAALQFRVRSEVEEVCEVTRIVAVAILHHFIADQHRLGLLPVEGAGDTQQAAEGRSGERRGGE